VHFANHFCMRVGRLDRTSWQRIVLTALLATLAIPGCAGVKPPAVSIEDLVLQAEASIEAQAWQRATSALDQVLGSRAFAQFPAAKRQHLLRLAGLSAAMQDELEQASALLMRAADEAGRNPEVESLLISVTLHAGDVEAAAGRVVRFVVEWPQYSGAILDPLLHLSWPGKLPAAGRLAYLQSLFDARVDERIPTLGRSWIDLALMRLDAGDAAAARTIASRVRRPSDIVLLRVDARFDGIVDRSSPDLDVARAAVDHIGRVFALLQSDAAHGGVLIELATSMYVAGNHGGLMRLGDSLIDLPEGDHLLDAYDARAWIIDTMSRAADALDETDRAVALMTRAAGMEEHGGVNVSHRLNLGAYLCDLGRADAAARAIETLGEMSGFGKLTLASVKRCIAELRGDVASHESAIAFLRANSADGPLFVAEQLLRVKDIDGAAELLQGALADPDKRLEALAWVQTYRELPSRIRGYAEARTQLLEREDVRQAIAAVGRIEEQPIFKYG
jgi:tetratricopeptide (TPR) repeat protein